MHRFRKLNFWVYILLTLFVTLSAALSFTPLVLLLYFILTTFSEFNLVNVLIWSSMLPASIILTAFSAPLLVAVFNQILNLVGIRVQEGSYPLDSRKGMAWWVHEQLVVSSLRFVHIVRIPILTKWTLKLLGAKIGSNTMIQGIVFDPKLFEIGNNSYIANATVSPHMHDNKNVYVKRIRIGNNCMIGHNSLILPGAVLEDGVTVGAMSLVPKNKVLTKGLWIGCHVRKVR